MRLCPCSPAELEPSAAGPYFISPACIHDPDAQALAVDHKDITARLGGSSARRFANPGARLAAVLARASKSPNLCWGAARRPSRAAARAGAAQAKVPTTHLTSSGPTSRPSLARSHSRGSGLACRCFFDDFASPRVGPEQMWVWRSGLGLGSTLIHPKCERAHTQVPALGQRPWRGTHSFTFVLVRAYVECMTPNAGTTVCPNGGTVITPRKHLTYI